MKRVRILLTTLLFVCFGTVCSFAEVTSEAAKKEPPWEIIAIVVVVILIAINEIKRSRQRRDRDDQNNRKK